ncbi:acetyltransferase [Streptomyces sp. AcH 505]|uniref:GNAT family N-acetyltransferase n=1 Tax=Streptomyces sp. AcH 505 TaxID=352211 RepID=UPI000591DFFE|nr:acetyltransferase [Streptomyces sp. AcH 505]
MATTTEPHILDNPAWAALSGPHAHLAERIGSAARYPSDVSPFVAVGDPREPHSWADLAALIGPGGTTVVTGVGDVPDGWETLDSVAGVQLVATGLRTEADPAAVRLGPADVPDMLDLVDRTRPGPFLPRTIVLGAYYGIREDGRLVAMAGERLRLPGWTEISAVCTDEAYRGRGLAARLIRHVGAGIVARGDTPFLHTAAGNTNAIRLYEALGFTQRRNPLFRTVRAPQAG